MTKQETHNKSTGTNNKKTMKTIENNKHTKTRYNKIRKIENTKTINIENN